MNTDQISSLIDKLLSLLEEQVQLLRKSNYTALESLMTKADDVLAKIKEDKLLEQPEFARKKEDLLELYRKIQLMIKAKMSSVDDQLKQVALGKKTLSKYAGKTFV